MHQQVRLVEPSMEYRDAYMSFYEDWKQSGEQIVPWVVAKDPADFKAMLEFLHSEDREDKLTNVQWVPHTTYWLINEQQEIVGAVNFRHRLNERLLQSGGHLGYGIRPSFRRRGYATTLLALALEKARERGLARVLVVCDQGNLGSERTILNNDGQFESEYVEADGNVVRRFWIEI